MAAKPRGNDANGESYEAHLEALDRVIADLEGDALSLEATIDRYKEGVAHLGSCRKILDAAEKRLAELVTTADGGVEERPLEVGPEGLVDAGPAGPARAAKPPRARPPVPPGASHSPSPERPGAVHGDDDLPF